MDKTNYTNHISIEQVSDSIECIRCRKFVKFYAILCIVLLLEVALLAYIFSIRDDLQHVLECYCILGAMFGSALVLMLSQIIYNLCRIKAIQRGVGMLPVYKVVFENIHNSIWRGTSFVLEIPDDSGSKVQTRAMFITTKPADLTRKPRTYVPSLYVDDFKGREVLIMYNPDRKKAYVLDFAANFNLPTEPTDTF